MSQISELRGVGSGQRATARAGVSGNAPKYPHPFFDQGQSYLPTSVKSLFNWCRFYFLTNPVVNSAITKMAEYPVTPILFKTDNEDLKSRYEEVDRRLHLKSFRVEVGLDYFTYGNAYISLYYPFRKYLKCGSCGALEDIKKADYKWIGMKYKHTCKKCGECGFAEAEDRYIKSIRGIRLIRWNPENIEVDANEITGKVTYTYDIPVKVTNDIGLGLPSAIEDLPDIFIRAVREKKRVTFNRDNLYHFKRPTLAQKGQGLGTPLVMPVLKDLHYLGILRRSQEAIAQEHIVPLRVIYPQPASASADPFAMINLESWKEEIEEQIAKWKIDPNRIPVMPLPLGYQTVGGEGKALILHQEYRVWAEHICAGMGVPPEFVFGGIQYSSTNLTMFQLHNKFLGYIGEQREMVFDFILRKISAFMGWPRIDGDFKAFKMADDLQRSMLYFQLNQAQKLSDSTVLEDLGMDPVVEREKMDAERGETLELQRRMQKLQAHIQGEVSLINNKYAMEAQQAMMGMQMGMQAQQQEIANQQALEAQQQQGLMQQQMNPQMPEVGSASPVGPPQPPRAPMTPPGAPTQEGAMTGAQVAPGFPEGATAYADNGQKAPDTGTPPWIGSESQGPQAGSKLDLTYVAKRAAAYIRSLDPVGQNQILGNMSAANPPLFQLVQQLLMSREGQQASGLNAMQMPAPEIKPPRRDASRALAL